MNTLLSIGSRSVRADLSSGIDLSVPLRFSGSQANVYGVEYASEHIVRTDTFTGNVLRGGSCNVSELHLIPHCNGTHTECVGHITRQPVSVSDVLGPGLRPASVVTLNPVRAGETDDPVSPELGPGEAVLDAAGVESALAGCDADFLRALVVRTTPNDDTKVERHYSDNSAPFFSPGAMHAIVAAGVRHLLVDLPSVDRLIDGGAMAAHRIFWGMQPDETDVAPGLIESLPEDAAAARTITELIYVPDSVEDGSYLLDLQIPPFVTDAAPSRPVLFPIEPAAEAE